MLVLGIETSGHSGSIAVVDETGLREEVELSATGRRHARTLVPEIGELLSRLQLTSRDLLGIAVSLGPGSFTGLRTGATCAKTLAYALHIPLVGIDTFQCIAEQATSQNIQTLWVIDDALRGDVFAGQYHRQSSITEPANPTWECIRQPTLISLPDFRRLLSTESVVGGPGLLKLKVDWSGQPLLAAEFCQPNAQQVAKLGRRALLAGSPDEAWTLTPHYIRRSAAEEKADQKL